MHGQEIAEELQKRRGFKPSPGTLYPALKYLKSPRIDPETKKERHPLIEGKKQGRKIIYRLVEGAQEEVDQACRYFCHVFSDIFEESGGKKS